MSRTVSIKVSIKPYRWHEFVHDVCWVLYAGIIISNALCKRYLRRSLPQLLRLFRRILKWTFWSVMVGIWSYLLIASALGWR